MKSNDRSLAILTGVSHAMVHTYELSIPIFITVWLENFTVTPAVLGNMAMLGYALFGFGGVPSGIAADKFNPKLLLLTALAGMSISFGLIGASPNLIMIYGAFALWGIAASIHHPSSLSFISRSANERGRVFAYHGMAGNFGIAFGPFITTLLLTFFSWRLVALILALPALIISFLGIGLSVEQASSPSDKSEKEMSIQSVSDFFNESKALFTSVYGFLFLVVVFEGLYYRGFLTFLPDFFQNLPQVPPIQISGFPFETGKYLYSGMLMLGMAGQYAGGRLSDHYNPRRLLTAVLSLLACLAFAFIAVESYPFYLLVLLSCLVGLVLFSAQPLYQATIAEHTPEENRGLAYGFSFFAIFGVGALGATLSGYVLTYYSASVLFLVLATLVLAATLILIILDLNITD